MFRSFIFVSIEIIYAYLAIYFMNFFVLRLNKNLMKKAPKFLFGIAILNVINVLYFHMVFNVFHLANNDKGLVFPFSIIMSYFIALAVIMIISTLFAISSKISPAFYKSLLIGTILLTECFLWYSPFID